MTKGRRGTLFIFGVCVPSKRGVLDRASFSGSKRPWWCHVVKPRATLRVIWNLIGKWTADVGFGGGEVFEA